MHYVKWIFLLTKYEIEDNEIRNVSTGVMRKKHIHRSYHECTCKEVYQCPLTRPSAVPHGK